MATTPQEAREALTQVPVEDFTRPPTGSPSVKAPKQQSFGNVLDNLGAAFDQLQPGIRDIALASVRERNPFLRGIPLTSQEKEIDELQKQRQIGQLETQIARDRINSTVAFLVDSASQPVNPDDKNSPTFQEVIQERIPGILDASLFDEPKRLAETSRIAAELLGQPQLALTEGQLIRGGLPSAMQSAQERGAERVSKKVKSTEDLTKAFEQETLEQQGKGPGAKLFEAISKQREEAGGVDVQPSGQSNIDTPAGAAELAGLFEQSLSTFVEQGLSPDELIDRFIDVHGDDIKDQLEEVQPIIDQRSGASLLPSGIGSTVVGFEEIGPQAEGTLAALIEFMGSVGRKTTAEIFQKLGLPFVGLEPVSKRNFRSQQLVNEQEQRAETP